jgi:hypothetical protein
MIDVAVIAGAAGWFGECIQTRSDEPARFVFSPHIEGDFNRARIQSFDRCSADLISFADPDDVVLPGALAECYEALLANPESGGVFTWETIIDAEGRYADRSPIRERDARYIVRTPRAAHHLIVVRRRVYEAVKPFVAQHKWGFDWALAVAAEQLGGLVNVPIVGYHWRIHGKNSCFSNRPLPRYGAMAAEYLSQGAAS